MDWHRCQTCEMSHPWRVPEEKPCPNAAIVARTGLKGLEGACLGHWPILTIC